MKKLKKTPPKNCHFVSSRSRIVIPVSMRGSGDGSMRLCRLVLSNEDDPRLFSSLIDYLGPGYYSGCFRMPQSFHEVVWYQPLGRPR